LYCQCARVSETAQFCERLESRRNDRTGAFTKRVQPRLPVQAPPTMNQAGCYSVTRQLAALGPAAAQDGRSIVAHMKATSADDDVFGRFTIREDGRALMPAYLFQVKGPSESVGPWDYYKQIATASPDEAWRPLSEGHCP
jgi:branched-chain amino acid transport system substrate-binding protein